MTISTELPQRPLPEWARGVFEARGYDDMSMICDWADALWDRGDVTIEAVAHHTNGFRVLCASVLNPDSQGRALIYWHRIVSSAAELESAISEAEAWMRQQDATPDLLQAASDLLDLWWQDDAPDVLAYEAACAGAERALADAVAAAKGQNDEVQR